MTPSPDVEVRVHGGRRALGAALLVHLASRLLTLATMAAAAHRAKVPFATVVTRWDGTYYRDIAGSGYPSGRLDDKDAFFPLFPALARLVMTTGLPFWLAAVCLNLVASLGAAALLARLVGDRYGSRVGLVVVGLWSAFPLAGALSATYSEALLCVFAFGCLLALDRHRWLTAGLLALLAGATRPTGAALAVCCLVAAVIAVARRRELRSLLAVVVSPWGLVASVAVIGRAAGRWDAWFAAERQGWHARFDGGVDTARTVVTGLDGASSRAFAPELAAIIVVVAVLAVVALVMRQPVTWRVHLAVGTVLAIGTSTVQASIARFMLPFFPILTPVALPLARARAWLVSVVLLLAMGLSLALTWFYWGVGRYAP